MPSEGCAFVFEDRAISCLDCGTEFTFTAGEQEFYAQRGFTEAPKRCASCRAARKAARQQATYDMAGGGYAAGGSYDAAQGLGAGAFAAEYRERRPREMFEAVCADCGRTASVPFRPSGVKPVYCSDCFQGRR
jgi:CxxC-x17-CxxC domain-containing protein